MRLTKIKVQDFRCFSRLELQPKAGINVITGDNASGKTSLLEVIHLLGRGQSFRRTPPKGLVRYGESQLVLNAWIRGEEESPAHHHLGVIGNKKGFRYKLNDENNITRYDLVTTIPLQLVDPNLHRLFELGPRHRRHFLDWGVFHVEHRFFDAWRQYRRALKQRNSALREKRTPAVVSAWDNTLLRSAAVMHQCRVRYVNRLNEILPENMAHLLGGVVPKLEYDPGWRHGEGLAAALQATFESDRRSGFTHQGPHRADLRVDMGGVEARARVSRGQQKVLGAALLLTQARILTEETGISPILLVDDLTAELGAKYQQALINEIESLGCQCFVTFLDENAARALCRDASMFHVEHGRIVERQSW